MEDDTLGVSWLMINIGDDFASVGDDPRDDDSDMLDCLDNVFETSKTIPDSSEYELL